MQPEPGGGPDQEPPDFILAFLWKMLLVPSVRHLQVRTSASPPEAFRGESEAKHLFSNRMTLNITELIYKKSQNTVTTNAFKLFAVRLDFGKHVC